jgi:phage-related protein
MGPPDEIRRLWYLGRSLEDMLGFPEPIRDEIATALEVARLGGKHPKAKPWHGLGSSIFEIALNGKDAFRTVYCVRFKRAIYVLHAFQKKSKSGRKTPITEVNVITRRLKVAEQHYREFYGKD